MNDFDAVVGDALADEMREADERDLHEDCDAFVRLRKRLDLNTMNIGVFEEALERFPASEERQEAQELLVRMAARAGLLDENRTWR